MENGQESKAPQPQNYKRPFTWDFFSSSLSLAIRVGRLEAINFQQIQFGDVFKWEVNKKKKLFCKNFLWDIWMCTGGGRETHLTFRAPRTKYLLIYSPDGLSAAAAEELPLESPLCKSIDWLPKFQSSLLNVSWTRFYIRLHCRRFLVY